MKTQTIDQEATSLLEQAFGNIEAVELPVDLNRITDLLNMEIREGTFVDKDIEGALDRQNRIIYLSDEDGYEEKNFAIAHEIGHYELHEDRPTDIFRMRQLERLRGRDVEINSDDPETEADYFALCLLMPSQLITPLWKKTKNIRLLARIFGVPEFIALCRLRNLKLVK
jgi:Zn-dependent peptidase ImmA (M78 family)